MKHYFIDFENVNHTGLVTNNERLDGFVYIFYTDSCTMVNMDLFSDIERLGGQIKFFHVKNGIKNALDFQLSTYLGFIISETNKEDKYVIISKDTGFDRVVDFWKAQNVKIKRKIDLTNNVEVNIPSINTPKITIDTIIKNKKDRQLVIDICKKYKNKNDLHNALIKEMGAKKGRTTYQQIKNKIDDIL
jgi:hypothetical protein